MTALTFPLLDRPVQGDRVTLPGTKNAFIGPRCTGQSIGLARLSCRQPLATFTQLLFHLETAPDQTHVVARLCGEHGWEA